ncbi:MAG: hypothetical protein EOP09_07195 [Proteobacteria bacterium]|nr:MAG: hypothetical protein EOP09_07195 [Pseudomonadota bacterium]
MIETALFALLLLIGIVLIIARPLARLTGIPIYWEIGAGSLLVIAFLFHLTDSYVAPKFSEEDLANKPCGSASPQGACYTLERALCEKAWDNADSTCKAEVKELLRDRPSAMSGPAVNRCKAKKMDQFLRYNRTNSESPVCKAYFEFIEAR